MRFEFYISTILRFVSHRKEQDLVVFGPEVRQFSHQVHIKCCEMANWMDPRHRNRARFDGYLRKLLDNVKVKPKNCNLRVFETFLSSKIADRPAPFTDDNHIVRTATIRTYHSQ